MTHELVMYVRRMGCPYVSTARRVLASTAVPCREVCIDDDPAAKARLLAWVGFLSVPTLIIAAPGSDLPLRDPAPLPPDALSPRGIDRGTMLTEPSAAQLTNWLLKHGFLDRQGGPPG